MSLPETVYMTQEGYTKFNDTLFEKQEEYRRISEDRKAAIQGVSEGDMNDPEIIQLQQQESGLKIAVNYLQDVVSRSKIIEINDSMRDVSTVRIGSIIKIIRHNITHDIEHPVEIWEVRGFDETDIEKKYLAYNSPLGSKLLGASAGEVVDSIKIGELDFEIEILDILPNW